MNKNLISAVTNKITSEKVEKTILKFFYIYTAFLHLY